MKIVIEPQPGVPGQPSVPYVLADFPGSGTLVTSTSGYTVTPSRDVQTIKRVRARYAQNVDRGNQQVNLSWNVVRTHNTVEDCEMFVNEHDELVPGSGLLVISTRDSSGRIATRFFPNAVIVGGVRSVVGISSLHAYQAVAAECLRVRPIS